MHVCGADVEQSLPQTLRHSRPSVLQTFRHFAYYNPVCPKHSATRILQFSLLQTLSYSHTTIQFVSNTPPLAYYNPVCFKHSAIRILQSNLPETFRNSHTTIQFAPNTPPLAYYNTVCPKHCAPLILLPAAIKTCPFVS